MDCKSATNDKKEFWITTTGDSFPDTDGEPRLKALETCLARVDNGPYRRSKMQTDIHARLTRACLHLIYGGGGDVHKDKVSKLREKINSDQPFQTRLIIRGPRQHGKRFAFAMFIAAYLWTQTNASITIWTPGLLTARGIMTTVLQMFPHILPKDYALEKRHQTKGRLVIHAADGSEGRLCICPCSPKVRGVWFSDITILYKPEFFADDDLRELLLPLLHCGPNMVILAVSTLVPDHLIGTCWRRLLEGHVIPVKTYLPSCTCCRRIDCTKTEFTCVPP